MFFTHLCWHYWKVFCLWFEGVFYLFSSHFVSAGKEPHFAICLLLCSAAPFITECCRTLPFRFPFCVNWAARLLFLLPFPMATSWKVN